MSDKYEIATAALAESQRRIEAALARAVQSGGVDGAHHKAWVIDQIVRELTGCPTVTKEAIDCRGMPYTYDALGESDEYRALVAEACDGEDGPDTYEWDVGCPP